jgi:hypothetical protein
MVVLLVFGALIYYVSMSLVMWKFNRWVDGLIGKYAAHVAGGGK